MKLVVAFVQPFMAEKVVRALHAVPGLSGASFTRVRGFGRGRGGPAVQQEELVGALAKLRIEVAVRDADVDVVVRAIRDGAHTGRRGDGKVYVVPLERAMRISTGDEGDEAV